MQHKKNGKKKKNIFFAYLTECGFVVETRTSFSMSACSNFKVKGTVDSEKKKKKLIICVKIKKKGNFY